MGVLGASVRNSPTQLGTAASAAQNCVMNFQASGASQLVL